jgi:hypothetical protein
MININAPGPSTPIQINVLQGVGSQPIQAQYLQNAPINFLNPAPPGPWTATVMVTDMAGNAKFVLTSGSGRVVLSDSGYNFQFQFLDSDFTGNGLDLGDYNFLALVIPSAGVPLPILYGVVRYMAQPPN